MNEPSVHREWAHFLKNVHGLCIAIFERKKLIQSDKTKRGDGSKFIRNTVHKIADRVQAAMR